MYSVVVKFYNPNLNTFGDKEYFFVSKMPVVFLSKAIKEHTVTISNAEGRVYQNASIVRIDTVANNSSFAKNFKEITKITKTNGELIGQIISSQSHNSISHFDEDGYLPSSAISHEQIKQNMDTDLIMNKGEKPTMGKNFKNFDFGKIENCELAYSIKGVAVGNAINNHSLPTVEYKVYENGEMVDVTDFIFKDIPLYKMPVSIEQIKVGDILAHQGTYVKVLSIKNEEVSCVDLKAATKITILPIKNMFGFNFYTKIINPFEGFMGQPNESTPFGNFLPIMFLSEKATKESLKSSYKDLLMYSMLFNQNSFKDFNPMMLMLMGEDCGSDILPLMMMMNSNFFYREKGSCKSPTSEVEG